MNKGNQRKTVRFEPAILLAIDSEIDRTNARRRGTPYEFGQWVRQACIDKLKHSARSRGASVRELEELDAFPQTGL